MDSLKTRGGVGVKQGMAWLVGYLTRRWEALGTAHSTPGGGVLTPVPVILPPRKRVIFSYKLAGSRLSWAT